MATLAPFFVGGRIVAQQLRAHHRRGGQRYHQRHQDGHRQGDGELTEESPDDAFHHQDGDEDGDERDAHRQHREAHLACAQQRRLVGLHAGLDMARDVFQHHDGIVHHEAGGNGQCHQRQVVQAETGQVHDAEGTDQRDRHGHRRDQRGARIAQEQEHHHDHQCHREHQGELGFLQGGANGRGAVQHHLHVDGRRNGRLQLWQQGAHVIDRVDDVGAGLAVDDDQHRGLAIGGAGIAHIGHRVTHLGHVAHAYRRAIAVGDDQRRIFGGGLGLVVGVDLPVAFIVFQYALGTVGIGGRHRRAHIGAADAVLVQGRRIELDAHGRLRTSAHTDLPHPTHLGQLLRHDTIGGVIHLALGHGVRGHGQDQDGRVGRVDLAIGRIARHAGRQQVSRRIQGGLHVAGGAVDVTVEVELQGDAGGVLRAGRGHLGHARDRTHGAFQRRGDGRGHGLGAGPGHRGGDRDGRVVHLRQRRHRQQAEGHHPGQGNADGQERGGDRPLDEGKRDIHRRIRSDRRRQRGRLAFTVVIVILAAMAWLALAETAAQATAQAVEAEIDHRRGEEREHLRHQQATDHGDAQRLAQLRTHAGPQHQRQRPQQGRHGGHQDGPEAQQASLVDRLARALALVTFGFQGEVDHHDGVLLDDADQQDDADDADDAQVGPRDHQREQRAHAGRRQRREDGDGVDVALIEHAQHDVHGDDGRQDQPQGIGQRRLEGQRRPLEVGDGGGRHADLVLGGLDGLDRLAQGRALGQVEGHGGCRELADMVHHQRRGAFGDGGNRGQRHLAAGRGHQVDAVQRRGAVLEFRLDLHHHAILVRLRIDGGDEALAEGVVERIVDGGRGDAQARGSIAVDLDVGLQTLVLQVGGHIGQFRLLLQAGDQLGHPGAEHVGIGIFQGELVLRARDAILDGQVLHRLHVQGHARHLLRQRGLQAADDIGGRDVALLVRLQVDEHAAAVEGGIGAIHADEGRQALDGRIGQHHLGQLLLLLAHGAEGDRLRGFRDALDHAGILQREEALGYEHIQQHRQAQRGHGHQQGRLLVFQHPLQHAAIAGDDVVEEHLALVIEPALLFFGLVAQQARAHHGRQGERDHGRDQDRHRQRHREFVEQAPHHIAHEEQRDQHGDQGEGQRDDGEADLLGPLQGGLHGLHALFDVARDVLDHDDGIVHHEAGGNRQGHQRQVVDREAGQVHDREGPHQRQRHRYAGDDGGRHVAQEHEDHHHHQGNGQHQGELDVFDRGADGLGTVDQGIDVDGGRNGGTQARHGGLDAAHGLDYVGTGLLGDGQHDGAAIGDAVVAAGGRTGEGPGGDLVVLGAVHGHADVLDADRRAIAPGQDHVIPLIGLEQLVVGIDREALVGAIDRTLGLVHGGGGDDTANVFQADAQRGDLGRIDLDAHGRFLLAVDVDQAHPRDLRDLLGQDVVGIVVDHRQRQFIGLHRHDHDGRIGRVDLAEGRGIGQVGRQLPGRRIDGGLHVQCSGIDVAVQVELQGDLGAAQGTLRGHLREAGNERELALQRLGHIGGHGLGTAAGQLRGDLDGREVHLRQRCHRQQRPDRHPHQQDGDGQQRGTDGAFDEGCGNAHLVLPFACALAALAVAGLAAAGLLSTMRAPGLSLYWPSSTTRSSGLRAASATSTAIPSWMRSTLTGCTKAWSWASTAQTQVPCWLRWMAAAGRVGTSPWVFICRRALTYWPGHSLWSALSKRAFSCTVPLLVLIWLSSKTSLPVARVSCESRAQATTLSGCWLSRWAWLMVPTASSGRVKSRVIGSIWLMTTRPLASAAWTILPGSTRRTPTRPEMGAVMVVQLSCTLAQAIWASSVLTAASSWATRAFCVSSCCWVAASWLRRVVQRCRSRRALSNCAASLARWASAWASWACRARGSIWASNWPFLTSSPSLKPTLSSCPSMRVLTVTLALAVTVPTPARQSGKSRCCTVVRLTDTGGAALAGAWSAALARCMCSQPPAPAARIRAVATATAVEERLGAWEDVVMPETRPEMIAGQIGIRRNGGWKPVSVRPSESLLRWPPGRPGSPASRRRQP
eukprot:TRINITY_DN118_c0_g1_i13.p1 TRINITY_DN118_c0_g1~~TRINITY_DN118_c0_g1_i13.p1  ORF type:complete len:2030 (+),score=744.92 TRINITY_DN118_c0_g1_i13:50280-56369(+)